MGEWREPISFKVSKAERMAFIAIHDALAFMHEDNLSLTFRWMVRYMQMKLITDGSLQLLLEEMQGLQRGTLYHSDKQSRFHFAAPKQDIYESQTQ